MENYFKRKSVSTSTSSPIEIESNVAHESILEDIQADPALRTPISRGNPKLEDKIRRAYLQKGPCQPRGHDFPYKTMGKQLRRFNPAWFNEFSHWLEYSVTTNAAYCLCCYLFKLSDKADAFVGEGFSNWKKKTTTNDKG